MDRGGGCLLLQLLLLILSEDVTVFLGKVLGVGATRAHVSEVHHKDGIGACRLKQTLARGFSCLEAFGKIIVGDEGHDHLRTKVKSASFQ